MSPYASVLTVQGRYLLGFFHGSAGFMLRSSNLNPSWDLEILVGGRWARGRDVVPSKGGTALGNRTVPRAQQVNDIRQEDRERAESFATATSSPRKNN
jgi:hypothetical protein